MGKIRIKLNNCSLIVFAFSILPIIDSFNGCYLDRGLFSIGLLYKFILIIAIAMILLINNKMSQKIFEIWLTVFSYVFFVIFINCMAGEVVQSKEYPIKLLFNISIFLLLIQMKKSDLISGEDFFKMLDVNTNLMIVCLLIPYFLGYGFSIYAGEIGYKGFFYSQNELTVTMIALFCFVLYKIFQNINIFSLLQLTGIIVCILLTNSKASMITCVLGVIVLIIGYLFNNRTKCKLALVLILGLSCVLAKNFIIEQYHLFVIRQETLVNIYNGSIIDIITSGRLFYVAEAWNELKYGGLTFFRFIFGNGFCSRLLCEMDFVDMFFFLGIIGVVLTIIGLVYVLKKIIDNSKNDSSYIRLFSIILLLGYSFCAGHVLFVSTSGCYFVIYCCFAMYYEARNSINKVK